MARHNQIRLVGYLLEEPKFRSMGAYGAECVLIKIRTCRRMVDNYNGRFYEDILLYYDGEPLMKKIRGLVPYDIIDVKGVVNILQAEKNIQCPYCGYINTIHGKQTTFVYPIFLSKIQSMSGPVNDGTYDKDNISYWLQEQYMEVSNQALLIGTVRKEPEFKDDGKNPFCRYPLQIDRKYYIPSQCDISADFPWVYSYGQQAEWDSKYLHNGSEILVDGFMCTDYVFPYITCDTCGEKFQFRDTRASFIPYSIEYLSNYLTDEDIALEQERELRAALAGSLS